MSEDQESAAPTDEGEHVFAQAGAASVSAGAHGPGDEAPPVAPALPPFQVESAFIVYKTPDGHWAADDNLGPDGGWFVDENHPPLMIGRKATFIDMFHAASDIVRDLNAVETANRTVMAQQAFAAQMGQKMAEQRQAAQIAAQLGDMKGGPNVPGGGMLLDHLRRPG